MGSPTLKTVAFKRGSSVPVAKKASTKLLVGILNPKPSNCPLARVKTLVKVPSLLLLFPQFPPDSVMYCISNTDSTPFSPAFVKMRLKSGSNLYSPDEIKASPTFFASAHFLRHTNDFKSKP